MSSSFPTTFLSETPDLLQRAAEMVTTEQERTLSESELKLHQEIGALREQNDNLRHDLKALNVQNNDRLAGLTQVGITLQEERKAHKRSLKQLCRYYRLIIVQCCATAIMAVVFATALYADQFEAAPAEDTNVHRELSIYESPVGSRGSIQDSACPQLYTYAKDVPFVEDNVWHFKKYKSYALEFYFFYSTPEEFGNDIILSIPHGIQEGYISDFSVKYRFEDGDQTLYQHSFSPANGNARIRVTPGETTHIHGQEEVKAYIAEQWGPGTYDPEELPANLCHIHISLTMLFPKQTYTHTTSFPSLQFEFLLLYTVSILLTGMIMTLVGLFLPMHKIYDDGRAIVKREDMIIVKDDGSNG